MRPPANAAITSRLPERRRVPPPPVAGERAGPVLLGVGHRAVEVEHGVADPRPPPDLGVEHDRLPVLGEPGDGVGDAERAEGAARPADHVVEDDVEPRVVAEVGVDAAGVAAQRAAHGHAEAHAGRPRPWPSRPCARPRPGGRPASPCPSRRSPRRWRSAPARAPGARCARSSPRTGRRGRAPAARTAGRRPWRGSGGGAPATGRRCRRRPPPSRARRARAARPVRAGSP